MLRRHAPTPARDGGWRQAACRASRRSCVAPRTRVEVLAKKQREQGWALRRTDRGGRGTFELQGDAKDKLTIGREPPCTLVVREDTISARHAELTLGQVCLIRDLGSTNGCVVNGRDVPRNGAAKLRAGDEIELGDAVFVLERVDLASESLSSDSEDGADSEESDEEEAEAVKPLRATGGLTVGEVRVGKRIGGGSFGTVFEGAVRGEAVVLKQANARVEGAVDLLELELQLNEVASKRAPDACATFIGALEVSDAVGGPTYAGKLSPGLWLVWRAQGANTLGFYLQRRGSTPALAAALGFEPRTLTGPELEAAVTRRVLVQTLQCLEEFHTAGLVHCDVKPQNLLIAEEEQCIRLIDLGGGASCIYPPLLSYSPGEGVHDPLYSPPETNLLPEGAKPPTLRNARSLWKEHAPYLFDLYSVGVVLMQLALPRLRTDAALKAFREQLAAVDGDLLAWREARATAADEAVLGQRDGAGWDLAAALLRPERVPGKGKGAMPGRASCAEALEHPFLADDVEADNDE